MSSDYIEKRKNGVGDPLGVQLSKKDTRKIQTSLAWKEIIDDPQYSTVEKRILQEMSIIMALPILAKSQEDVKLVRSKLFSIKIFRESGW